MSTSEYRAVDAESDLPISAAELAALANQLYAASVRPGFDSPPQSAPVAPRGNAPDTTAAASAGQTAAGAADLYPVPVPLLGVSDVYLPAPTSPEPEPPPQAVPVAPRGNVPDTTAGPSTAATAGGIADPFVPGDLRAFGVPHGGHRPAVAGSAGRRSADVSSCSPRFGAVVACRCTVGSRAGLDRHRARC